MGHLTDADLLASVRRMLEDDPPCLLRKGGRPYIDYALRNVHFDLSGRGPEGASLRRLEMVEMLFRFGNTANDVAWPHENRTVWGVYLDYLPGEFSMVWDREVAWALIHNGARRAKDFRTPEASSLSMAQVLSEVYRPGEARKMCAQIDKNSTADEHVCRERAEHEHFQSDRDSAGCEQVTGKSASSKSKRVWPWRKWEK